MEPLSDFKDSGKGVTDSKGQMSLPHKTSPLPVPSEIEGNVERKHPKSLDFASATPEKLNETSHVKWSKEADLLPEKYRTLLHFLDRMACSLRLLALCNKSPTFRNICRQVEIFSGRVFEYKHLAQIKYLLPEAVQIDKILVHNPKTMCMDPDIKITLTLDVFDGHHEEEPVFMSVHHLFASRLNDFLNKNPEACDIPEAVLPEGFKQRDAAINTDPSLENILMSTETKIVKSSHFCPSFSKHFSEKAIGNVSEKTGLLASPCPGSSSSCDSLIGEESAREWLISDSHSNPTLMRNSVNSSPLHTSSTTFKYTSLKFVSESDNLILQTPAQSTPKRSLSTCEGNHKTMPAETCLSGNRTAKRPLDFSNLDNEESSFNGTARDADQTKTLPKSSTQMEIKRKTISASSITSCEDKMSFCNNGGKSLEKNQCCITAHHQTSISLYELTLSIQKIFHSVNRHSITKEELVHKIIMNNCDIDENGHIEEQIGLLEKLVPGWICQTLAPSGDLLYSIEKVQDFNSVLEKVAII